MGETWGPTDKKRPQLFSKAAESDAARREQKKKVQFAYIMQKAHRAIALRLLLHKRLRYIKPVTKCNGAERAAAKMQWPLH